jgi:formylglycine-generating enzyme required for sulfatase activity
MARVLIVHHKWDADVALPLAGRLRRCGLIPATHQAGEPGSPALQRPASVVIILWSGALAVDEAALRDAAMLASQRGARLLRIDDTEPPPEAFENKDLRMVSAYEPLCADDVLLRRLGLDQAARTQSPLVRVMAEPQRRRVGRRPGLWGAALGVLVLAILGLTMAWRENDDALAAATALAHAQDQVTRPALARDVLARLDALLESEDPLAIRAALQGLETAPEAARLRARADALEEAAWREAARTSDAAARLLAIEAFRASFPGSPRLTGVVATAVSEARDHIVTAQRDLGALGFAAGPANGVMRAETEEAVRAFQTEIALPATGLIDTAFLGALERALGERLEGGGAWSRSEAPGSSPRLRASQEGAGREENGRGTRHHGGSLQGRGGQGGDQRGDLVAAASSRSSPGARSARAAAGLPRPSPLPAFSVIQDCPSCPSLVVLPQGRGQVGDGSGRGEASARPVRLVALDYGLAMGRFEVTLAEWRACVADGACPALQSGNQAMAARAPVAGVSYEDAKLYLAWLQRRTGHGYRLPSEAEWELAARAGAIDTRASDPTEALCAYGNVADGASAFPDRDAVCRDGFPAERAPVGQFRPNAFGLYDMTGNVWEWTEDCWHRTYQRAPQSPAPWLRGCDTGDRVLRGGSYRTGPQHNRLSTRLPLAPDLQPADAGFRVVRPVAE